jgi:hypothetical protein
MLPIRKKTSCIVNDLVNRSWTVITFTSNAKKKKKKISRAGPCSYYNPSKTGRWTFPRGPASSKRSQRTSCGPIDHRSILNPDGRPDILSGNERTDIVLAIPYMRHPHQQTLTLAIDSFPTSSQPVLDAAGQEDVPRRMRISSPRTPHERHSNQVCLRASSILRSYLQVHHPNSQCQQPIHPFRC